MISLLKFKWKSSNQTAIFLNNILQNIIFGLSVWISLFSTSLTLNLSKQKIEKYLVMGDESDSVFVLIIAGMFLSISLVFYFCDSKFRNSFYFDGDDSTGTDLEMESKIVV